MITELAPTVVTGIWDDEDLFAKYQVSLQFTGRVMGGVPQRPDIIEGWIRQRVMSGDDAVKAELIRTMIDLGIDVSEGTSMEDLQAAAKKIATEQHGNTFRRDEHGLFVSAYQIKAALKECTNILYAGDRWGITKKGPKSFLAERVFIDEERIYLGRTEPDGMHLQVGNITGPKGPRSTLTYYDFVDNAQINFTVSSLDDCITPAQWKEIFLTMQKNGIGALRSMGYGMFKVTGFTQVSTPPKRKRGREE